MHMSLPTLPKLPTLPMLGSMNRQQGMAYLRSVEWLQAFAGHLAAYGSRADGIPTMGGAFPTQTDPTKIPLPSACGVLFDGSNDAIPVDMSAITTKEKVTLYVAVSSNTDGMVMETTTTAYNQNGLAGYIFTGGFYGGLSGSATLSNYKASALPVDGSLDIYTTTHDRTAAAADEVALYKDGLLYTDYSSFRDIDTTGNFAVGAGSWLGARNNGVALPLSGRIFFVGVRDGIDSPGTIDLISRALRATYGHC